jgi:cytochrome c peroxidase
MARRRVIACAVAALGLVGPGVVCGAQGQGAPVVLRFVHGFEGDTLIDGNVALRTARNTLSVTRAAYLLSNFALVNSAGERVEVGTSEAGANVALVDATARVPRERVVLVDVPAGDYVELSFDVGLPDSLNHSDPSRWGPGHALNPSVNNLHWNWQGGYVFFALEGRWVQADDTLGGYVFHVATRQHLTRVTLPAIFTHGAEASGVKIELDVARVFGGVHTIALSDDPASHTTHSAPGDELAANIASNLARAFAFGGKVEGAAAEGAGVAEPAPVELPAGTTAYPWQAPQHFPRVTLPWDNPLTEEGVALGERLFFDVRLSGNDVQSCATCHVPARAFSDGVRVPLGAYGDAGRRNTMALFNLAWSQESGYTWDGRKARVRDQALQPIEDAREMRQSLPETIAKLEKDASYPQQFARAFGSEGISSERLGLALEQYLLTLVAKSSKYDRVVAGEATFTELEKRGFELFNGEYDPARGQLGADCFHCHGGHLFSNYQFVNNGIDGAPGASLLQEGVLARHGLDERGEHAAPDATAVRDAGYGGVSDRLIDFGRFKTPSLRNVARTAPYMHDGRFATLMDVLTHYSQGVQPSPGLDPNLAKHLKANAAIAGSEHHAGVNLSDADKAALIAFLETLSDEPAEDLLHEHGAEGSR